MACPPRADSAFGPLVDESCRAFDFTLYFEESIMRIGPAVLFIVVAIPRLFILYNRPRYIERNRLMLAKIIATVAYVLPLLVAVFYSIKVERETSQLTKVTIASAIVNLAAGIVLCCLSPFEHLRTIRPSTIISSYLFFSIVFDAAYVRTAWFTDTDYAALATALLSVKLVIVIIEGLSKRSGLLASHDTYSKDELSGFFSKSLFLWLIELLRVGYGKVITVEDLYPLEMTMRSSTLKREFVEPWKRASTKHKSGSLFIALAVSLKWHILYPVFPLLCYIAFTFAQPLMLNRVLEYLATMGTASPNIGYGLIGAYAVVYTGIAISMGWYQYLLYRFITMVRGILIALIYEKTLKTSIVVGDDSEAVTLMSTDVERIVQGLFGLYESWSTALQVAIAAYLLQREIGFPFFLPIVLCFGCAFVALGLSVVGGQKQIPWLDAIKDRLAVTSSMIKGMKGVKMLGLSDRLEVIVAKLRASEIAAAFQYRLLMSSVIVVAFMPQAFAPVVSFGAALNGMSGESNLASGKVFTSLLLLRLLTQPLTHLFQAVPLLVSAIGCIRRIDAFARSEERLDLRSHSVRPSSTASSFIDMRFPSETPESIQLRGEKSRHGPASSEVTAISEVRAVRVMGANIGWTTGVEGRATVKNVDLNLNFAQLTIMVGPAGSGKSTLLKGLLGETPMLEGKVEICEQHVAFCDQSAWLTNGTIQENILGVSTWSQSWYKTVVYACALDEDFANIAGGDQADLGSNGINLSGGQKQRVAMARAVYSRCKIILLDDVLSGLDRKTDQLLFRRLLSSEGLLRREGVCVFLATHSVHHLPNADWIVALNSEGEVSEQGTFSDLRAGNGYVGKLDLSQKEAGEDSSSAVVAKPKGEEKSSEYSLGVEKALVNPGEGSEGRQMGDFAVYMYYFRASGLGNFAFYAVLQLAWAFLENFPTIWLQWWSEDMAREPPHHDNYYYFGVYTAFQFAFVITLACLCAQVLLRMQVISGNRLHQVILSAAIGAQMQFFNLTDAGVILNIFSQDLQILDYELPFALQNTVANALASVAQAILLLPASYWLGLSFPFLLLAFWLIQRFYLRTSRQLRLLDLEAKSPLYTSFMESLAGLATIRAFGWEKNCMEANLRLLDHSQRPFYLLYCLQRWLTLVLDLLVAGMAVLLITLATQLKTDGPGFTGVALFNLANLAQTMTQTVTTWTLTEVAMGAVARIKTFHDETPYEHQPGERNDPPPDWPTHGSVEFEGVSAKYKEDGVKVMNNLSLRINPGEKVAICGRTGSGKSTLISVLFRMLDPSEGRILIDGLDLNTLPRNVVRARLNAIPQEPFFVAGSIRTNLDINGTATDVELTDALRRVQLAKTIENMGGLDCKLDPDLLSHGQRQMFCLARAILRRSSIVVLDEATSSVDIETDKTMQTIIRSVFKDCTIIAIAHRLDTVLDFDKVAVLDHGELVELDSPKLLLERDSLFRSMYEASSHESPSGKKPLTKA